MLNITQELVEEVLTLQSTQELIEFAAAKEITLTEQFAQDILKLASEFKKSSKYKNAQCGCTRNFECPKCGSRDTGIHVDPTGSGSKYCNKCSWSHNFDWKGQRISYR